MQISYTSQNVLIILTIFLIANKLLYEYFDKRLKLQTGSIVLTDNCLYL